MNKEKLIKFANEEIIGRGNSDAISEIFSPEYIVHTSAKDYKGHEFIKRFVKQVRTAVPDVSVRKVEVLSESGNTVVWQRMLRGTHKADMMGIPPSNKKVEWTEMLVTRFEKNKIAEEWAVSELAGQLLLKLPAVK